MWRRALKDTLPDLGNSWGKGIRNVVFLAIALFFVRWFGGGEQMSEEARWLLSSGIALLIVLAGLFLFNLIRAPVYLEFEKGQLQRIHVELWSFGSYLLPKHGLIDAKHGVYSLYITVTNQSDSLPLGIARFNLAESGGTGRPIDPVPEDRVQGFTVFGGARPFSDLESMPHNLYLRPKESKTGQLVFFHDEKIEKPKLWIVGGEGIYWTMDIHGRMSPKMGKHRAVEIHELC